MISAKFEQKGANPAKINPYCNIIFIIIIIIILWTSQTPTTTSSFITYENKRCAFQRQQEQQKLRNVAVKVGGNFFLSNPLHLAQSGSLAESFRLPATPYQSRSRVFSSHRLLKYVSVKLPACISEVSLQIKKLLAVFCVLNLQVQRTSLIVRDSYFYSACHCLVTLFE